MIIYIIIKFIVRYYIVIRKKWIKNVKIVDLLVDLQIILYFVYLIYLNKISLWDTKGIFLWANVIIMLFLIYRGMNYVLNNIEKIFKWVDKKERIKNMLLKPKMNKLIYYAVWSLPWNMGYWIYFWVMENGWYFVVWFCSNRDIFFWKYFGWDSRDFFYQMREKMGKKRNYRILEVICRYLLVIYWLRGKLQGVNINEYLWVRMIIYLYLSIFYLYFAFYFHIVNYYLFIVLICVELLLLIYLGKIITYLSDKYIEELRYLVKENMVSGEFLILMEYLREPLITDLRYKWEVNVFVWDKILSNSVTLNILYKYMIWVNERTEGYYDKKMGIRSRVHRNKLITEKSIIWDVLPRTRYVMVSLKYWGLVSHGYICQGIDVSKEYEFINLKKNRNFYLAYYEKAYSSTSMLMFFWNLRMNLNYWASFDATNFEDFKNGNERYKQFFRRRSQSYGGMFNEFILYYYTLDKRFFGKDIVIRNNIIFGTFWGPSRWYAIEELYSNYNKNIIIKEKKELKIPTKFVSIEDYKLMFKVMGRIQLYEEEAIVWSKEIQEILMYKEKFMLDRLRELRKNEELEKWDNSYYNRFFFTTDFDLSSPIEKLDSFVEKRIFFFNTFFKTKIPLEEVFTIFFYYGDLRYLSLWDIDQEKINSIISQEIIEGTRWDDHLEMRDEGSFFFMIRILIQFECYYNMFIFGDDFVSDNGKANVKELIEKYDLMKWTKE